MPICPEHVKKYPADWVAISLEVRAAAHFTCQGSPQYPNCRARNGFPHPSTGSPVVLTVGHLDHTPENCERSNLRAWCQRCHLTYDAEHHAKNAAIRRARQLRDAGQQVIPVVICG